jgi:hypothetical protein
MMLILGCVIQLVLVKQERGSGNSRHNLDGSDIYYTVNEAVNGLCSWKKTLTAMTKAPSSGCISCMSPEKVTTGPAFSRLSK